MVTSSGRTDGYFDGRTRGDAERGLTIILHHLTYPLVEIAFVEESSSRGKLRTPATPPTRHKMRAMRSANAVPSTAP
jgi:hypothetical protein